MSANNELLIRNIKRMYIVENVDVESGRGFEVVRAKTLKGAIQKANKYSLGEEVEYGLRIVV